MKVVSNSNGLEERAAAASPNLKLVPEPDWMGSERGRGREGGRLVNAKIEILGATDLYNGSEASVLLSPPLRGGPDWNAKNQLVFFTCSTLRARESWLMLQGSEGSQVINIEIHGIIYQYFTQFNVIRADNERVRERERERESSTCAAFSELKTKFSVSSGA